MQAIAVPTVAATMAAIATTQAVILRFLSIFCFRSIFALFGWGLVRRGLRRHAPPIYFSGQPASEILQTIPLPTNSE